MGPPAIGSVHRSDGGWIGAAARPPARRSFAADPLSLAPARRFVQRELAGCDPELVADAVMAASELATNAVVHARTDFSVTVECTPDCLRVTVSDAGPGLPELRPTGPLAETGRGLLLVNALATRWGVENAPRGKVVWAEFDAEPARRSR